MFFLLICLHEIGWMMDAGDESSSRTIFGLSLLLFDASPHHEAIDG
jgi:hypothetical protein